MVEPHFGALLEYFVVPLGVLFFSYVAQGQFRLKYSSGTDFYVFFLSLDLNAILLYSAYAGRINPRLASDYLAVFVFLVIVCLIVLGFTLSTQVKIDAWRSGESAKYPWLRVATSWFATVLLMPTHLFVFFGR